MHYNRQNTKLGLTPNIPLPDSDINALTFEIPQETKLENGLVVWDVKPKKPKRSYHITKPIIENLQITEIKVYTEKLVLGGDWQGEVIAPIASSGELNGSKATHYLVKNIWLELISLHKEGENTAYTFRIQTAFMVELPQVVYLYKQGSKIVVGEASLVIS